MSGCTGTQSPAASTAPPSASPSSAPAASSPAASPASATPGVTQTATGYVVTGNSDVHEQKVALEAKTYTFHITLADFKTYSSGQVYLTGTGGIAGQQVKLVMFTDDKWGPDMTITKEIPAAGDYKLTVSYSGNWEVDISQ